MKVRFTYWNKEHAEDFKTIAPRIKKIAKVEVINSCEFIVTFKPGTKYEYIKGCASSATMTLA